MARCSLVKQDPAFISGFPPWWAERAPRHTQRIRQQRIRQRLDGRLDRLGRRALLDARCGLSALAPRQRRPSTYRDWSRRQHRRRVACLGWTGSVGRSRRRRIEL